MDRSIEEIAKLITTAKEMGVSEIKLKGFYVKFKAEETKVSLAPSMSVPDAKPEELVKPMSKLDDLSDEEILYYATPYYDELQAQKDARSKQLAEENAK